ncbi:MAG: hypothetical protein KAI79_12225 [Bacteroidales bacterium]|nr:hypothetical protein [Bacteroidales bacterium]
MSQTLKDIRTSRRGKRTIAKMYDEILKIEDDTKKVITLLTSLKTGIRKGTFSKEHQLKTIYEIMKIVEL